MKEAGASGQEPVPGKRRAALRAGLSACTLGLALAAGVVWGQSRPPAGSAKPPQGVGDVELVEQLLAARLQYQRALEKLRFYYVSTGDVERSRWAEDELKEYHLIAKQAYRLDLDVPPPTLQGNQNMPEANKIYQRAMSYKNRGYGKEYLFNQRRSELLFQQILSRYPQCDKIGDAAFQLGEIYESSAYKQYRRAAMYYERCFQWHQHTHFDARLRAARIYDRQLLERGRAIDLYKEVKNHETDPKQIEEADKRLAELNGSR